MEIESVRQFLKRNFDGPEVVEALRFRLETHLDDPTRDPLSAQVWNAYLELPKHLNPPFTLLDAGCMSGFLYHHLKRYFDFTYTGVDRWPEALQVGREFAPHITFIEGDFIEGKFGEFDYVVCSNIPWKGNEQYNRAIQNLLSQARRGLFMINPNAEILLFERTPGSLGNAGTASPDIQN